MNYGLRAHDVSALSKMVGASWGIIGGNTISIANQNAAAKANDVGDTLCLALPMFHSYGLMVGQCYLAMGKHVILSPLLKPDTLLKLICQYHAADMCSVGAIYGMLTAMPEFEEKLSGQLNLCIVGGGFTTPVEMMPLELFGEERLTQSLNRAKDIKPESLINRIHDSIQEFVNDASQFDDITMLCVKYLGQKESTDSIKNVYLNVPASVECLDKVIGFTEEQLENAECPPDDIFAISLAVEEIFVNIANYAYDGNDGDAEIKFSFDEDNRMVEMVFSDSGIPFDPTLRSTPDIKAGPKQRPIGGLGIYIVKKTMDEVDYQYLGGKNSLTIRKHI